LDAERRVEAAPQTSNVVVRRSGATLQWAINRPEDIARAVPGIRLLAAVSAFQTDTIARLPAVYRLMSTAMALIPALRTMAQYQRYEFFAARARVGQPG
jgi:hypothetical protein